MPGHKGHGSTGCEAMDITEVAGADALYEAEGIIAESERNAAALFKTAATFYSTEGSSQCIRAMLYLTLCCRKEGTSETVLAFRNVHRSFIYACALLNTEVEWLTPREGTASLCSCPIGAEELEEKLSSMPVPPAAVYVTSPDYLGNTADITGISAICRKYGTRLIVDNAHGAYLHFLSPSRHPIDLGADMCCDSAHKTLPVLTGGAYLHIAKDEELCARAKSALALFGSTSPSYLTLCSLDECNRYLADGYGEKLSETVKKIDAVKSRLIENGWQLAPSDPLKITVHASLNEASGYELADKLRKNGAEPEFADPDDLVMMLTPENSDEDFEKIVSALGKAPETFCKPHILPKLTFERVCSIREALFSKQETVKLDEALGKICGTPTVACPPAIPVAVSGERISRTAIDLLRYYGAETIDIVRD